MVDAAQIRAARAMLGWKQQELAGAAGVSRRTVVTAELDSSDASAASRQLIAEALERAGVTFTSSPHEVGVAIGRKRSTGRTVR